MPSSTTPEGNHMAALTHQLAGSPAVVQRQRRKAFADSIEDVSAAGQGAERLKEVEDKMVLVEIERDFTLTADDHVPHHYKKGVDEMPLSHAKHWWAKAAGGVKLYIGKRATKEQRAAALAHNTDGPVVVPQPDPDKLPSAVEMRAADLSTATTTADPARMK